MYYYCLTGWGFRSTGKFNKTILCQENREWSLSSVEPCTLLPCKDPHPPAPEGGTSWYDIEATRFKCPPTHMFPDGSEFAFSNCTKATKLWSPPVLAECVGQLRRP